MAYYTYSCSNYDYQRDYNPSDDYYSLNSSYRVSHPVHDSITDYSNNSFTCQIYAHYPTPPAISSSLSLPTHPDHFEYDPVQFSISYSVSDFSETDYEEYDPTPYGGGYDLALTYGNGLPPSDDICYPHSAATPPILPLSTVPSAPIYTPPGEAEPTAAQGRENDVLAQQESGDGHEAKSKPTACGVVAREEGKEESNGSDSGSGSRGEYGYGYEKETGEMPYGYGLEAMDICESLFGYWPCISRLRRKMGDCEQVVDCRNCSNPWDGSVDYLFGSTNPYDQTRGDYDGRSCMNGYQMHYLGNQVEEEDSWS